MALKINLKPNEKMIIGGAVVKNGDKGASLIIENNVPILREKDIMSNEEESQTFCSGIYFIIQLMYIDGKNTPEYHKTYWKRVRELVEAAPRTVGIIDQISRRILDEDYYQALKLAKKLLEYEKETLRHAHSAPGSI